jgi:hypothetical protein
MDRDCVKRLMKEFMDVQEGKCGSLNERLLNKGHTLAWDML